MTQKFRFYGSSDDNFCYDVWKGNSWRGEDEIGSDTAAWIIEDFGQQGLQVVGIYAGASDAAHEGSVWSVGIAQLDEDVPLPDWPIKFSVHELAYSVALEIEIPDSAKIRAAGADDGDPA